MWIQSATTSTVVNGVTVPVIDVSGGLDGTGDSSNESSASQAGQHHSEVEITSVATGTVVPQEQPSPHFITVTGKNKIKPQNYKIFTNLLDQILVLYKWACSKQ